MSLVSTLVAPQALHLYVTTPSAVHVASTSDTFSNLWAEIGLVNFSLQTSQVTSSAPSLEQSTTPTVIFPCPSGVDDTWSILGNTSVTISPHTVHCLNAFPSAVHVGSILSSSNSAYSCSWASSVTTSE